MLYVKKIDEITYEDVQDFCHENIKERETLEYKSIITKELDKEISALANTYGGIIIIGVNDDKDGNPKPPFEGIDYKKGLGDRITQIDVSNIYPPVFPEIQVCPEENNKTFIVIRIPQSNSTPHYIMDKTKAYVRTGSINTPQRIADVNELEWLRNKRDKAISFREHIVSNADTHFGSLGKLHGMDNIPGCILSISMCPLFPSKPIFQAQIIEEKLMYCKTEPRITYNEMRHYQYRPIQHGLASYLIHGNTFDFLEINQFGLITKKHNLRWKPRKKTEEEIEDNIAVPDKIIGFEHIFVSVLAFFEFIDYFYEQVGYHGYCNLDITISATRNVALNTYIGRTDFMSAGISIDTSYSLPEEFYLISIPNFREVEIRIDTVISICKNIAWAFGSEIDPTFKADDYLRDYSLALVKNSKR